MFFRCVLGLNQKLSKTVMFGWLQELTPQERSDLAILRILRKLIDAGMECTNHNQFLNELKTIPENTKEKYMKKEIPLKSIKQKFISDRNKELGINSINPFEQLGHEDSEWLRLVTGELDIYRWKDKTCNFCNECLNTVHILSCKGSLKLMSEIEDITNMKAEWVIKDPSLLNN